MDNGENHNANELNEENHGVVDEDDEDNEENVENWLAMICACNVPPATIADHFNELDLFTILCFSLKSIEHTIVVMAHFNNRYPNAIILVSFEQNKFYFEIQADTTCRIGVKEDGATIVLTIKSDDRTGEMLIVDHSKEESIVMYLKMFLTITGVRNMRFKRKNSNMFNLHKLVSLNIFHQIRFLFLDVDQLSQQEIHVLLNEMPHKQGLKLNITKHFQVHELYDGSIKTDRLICSEQCSFVNLLLLQKSRIRSIQMEKRLDHYEVNFLLYSWIAGDFNELQDLKLVVDDSFEYDVMMDKMKVNKHEEVTRRFGLFQAENLQIFNRKGWRTFEQNSVLHLYRNDGKVATVVFDKQQATSSVFVIIWSDDYVLQLIPQLLGLGL